MFVVSFVMGGGIKQKVMKPLLTDTDARGNNLRYFLTQDSCILGIALQNKKDENKHSVPYD